MVTSDSEAISDCDLSKTEEIKPKKKMTSTSETAENYDKIKQESRKLLEVKKNKVPPLKNQIPEDTKKKSNKPSSDKPSSDKPSSGSGSGGNNCRKIDLEIKRNNKVYVYFNKLVYLEADEDKMTKNDKPLVYETNIKDRKQSAELTDDCYKILAWFEAKPKTQDCKAYRDNQMVEWLLLESSNKVIFRYSLMTELKKYFELFDIFKSNPLPCNLYLCVEFDYEAPEKDAYPRLILISYSPSESFGERSYPSIKVKALHEKAKSFGSITKQCETKVKAKPKAKVKAKVIINPIINTNDIINDCETEQVKQIEKAELEAELKAELEAKGEVEDDVTKTVNLLDLTINTDDNDENSKETEEPKLDD